MSVASTAMPAHDSGRARRRHTYLILTQVYVPDPASVGQHVADAAVELAARGHRVVVLTADRGYDDPSARYPPHEVRDGVEVRRLPWSSFGKRSIAVRLAGGVLFMLQAVVRGITIRGVDAVLVSTSPPMAALGAVIISLLRRIPVKFWVMDLNPDQMVALGLIGARSLQARTFDMLNRLVLWRAADVVVLDRFMAQRVTAKRDVRDKLTIIPPWPHDDCLGDVPHEDNPFRHRHGLGGQIVVMYSGNHGPSNPLTTVLRAAERLADEPDLVFMFVGGGVGKREVDAAAGRTPQIRSLPYQPLAELRDSLSAADVHLVSVGDAIVGIVHPCKVYGAMAVGRPLLLLGPAECHVADLMRDGEIGWHVYHGDVDGAVSVLRRIARMSREERMNRGAQARARLQARLTKAQLCSAFCDVVERGVSAGDLAPRHAQPA